jgi:CDGSH-type Zn-finger protein
MEKLKDTVMPSIAYQKNGPYIVKQVDHVIDSDGRPLVKKAIRTLCRCGGSGHKPFCDGSHITIGFDDQQTERLDMASRERYIGEQITIYFNRALCSDSGVCYSQLPSVFGSMEDKVVDPDADLSEVIAEIVGRCPSGALSCSLDEPGILPPREQPGIIIEKNGPYHVWGGIVLEGHEKAVENAKQYSLCRCGGSERKPFCNGSHKKNGFRDDGLQVIARTDNLTDELTRVTLENRELVIVMRENNLSVFSGVCLHMEALLAEGFIEDNYLTCGKHRWRYHLDSGELDGDPATKLKKLNSHIENGQLLIRRSELNELQPLSDE